MLMNKELTALQEQGVYGFDEVDIGGRKTVVIFPDGRRNLLPYTPSSIRNECRWTNVTEDLALLSGLTGDDALGIAAALHQRVSTAIPDFSIMVDAFSRRRDTPIRFRSSAGRLTVRGGFPISMSGVDAEATRIIGAYADARKVVDAEIATWRRTTIDAFGVAAAAGLSGVDGDTFFRQIARSPESVEGVVGDSGEAVTSVREHLVSFPQGLVIRVMGRTVTATVRTSAYTLDGCKLIIKKSADVPDTLLSAIQGKPLDTLVTVPGLDGSELIIDRVKVRPAGKKLQMTVQLVPRPLRMEEARELYDRIQARAA